MQQADSVPKAPVSRAFRHENSSAIRSGRPIELMQLGLMTAKFENFLPLEMNSCFISTSDTAKANSCLICDSATVHVGIVRGVRTPREFSLRQCSTCGFAFVENPWTDYARIYDNATGRIHSSTMPSNFARTIPPCGLMNGEVGIASSIA